MLARAAGMPMKILDAYLRFQEELETVNTIVGGLGRPYKRRCGIPQGDPLSMLMVALLMRAWVSKMKTMDVKPSLLVDDILVIAEGKDMALKFKKAMDATHQYLKDMGGTIAPNKSHNSASTNAMKKWLKNHVWEVIGGKVEVVQHFNHLLDRRDLRGQDAGEAKESKTHRPRVVVAVSAPSSGDCKPSSHG